MPNEKEKYFKNYKLENIPDDTNILAIIIHLMFLPLILKKLNLFFCFWKLSVL